MFIPHKHLKIYLLAMFLSSGLLSCKSEGQTGTEAPAAKEYGQLPESKSSGTNNHNSKILDVDNLTSLTEKAYTTSTRVIMATPITVVLPKGNNSDAAAEAVFDIFREVDARASEWKETSPLARVNREAGGAPVTVPRDLFDLVKRGLEVGEKTHGAFDITWAAMWGLWDFRAERHRVPSKEEVAARVARVDYKRLLLDEASSSIRLPEKGMKVGLGGIAKGWALDLAAAKLAELGVESYSLSAGGQIAVKGKKGDRLWRVGVRDPRGPATDYFAVLEVSDTSVATSGDYERFFIKDGVRYHHIIDPRTGYPARGLRSVTVLSPDATLADALGTALMVMGRQPALDLVDSLQGVEAVLVDEKARVYTSSGLGGMLSLVHSPEE